MTPEREMLGISPVAFILFVQGDLCPKCGYGTRKTSKRWARCKRCNERVSRRELPAAHKEEAK